MKYDGQISIATGSSASRKIWKNEKLAFSQLVERLSNAHVTHETFSAYMAMTKQEQANIKDVGGFVGGYLRNGRRKPENVQFRQLLTLDLDFANLNFWDDFCMQYDCAAVLHSTHKHCEKSPRYRLIIPVNREISADEYTAISRRIAGNLGINLFDPTTFEVNRLMFWPSVSKDAKYVFNTQDGKWLDADYVLSTYINWRDISEWPFANTADSKIRKSVAGQEDPTTKNGIVGAFCRTYSMQEAIDEFLRDEYISVGDGIRYTYSKGTTAAGLIIYDDKFAYSHHSSDPVCNRLCNAFDIVRIHKYGLMDEDDSEAHGNKAASYKAMEKFAMGLSSVKKTIISENLDSVKYDFASESYVVDETAKNEELDSSWQTELEIDTKGNFTSSASNITMILANDPNLKGKFKYNSFDNKRYIFSSLPWRVISEPEPIKDVDYSGVRNYIESIYGIVSTQKIDDALALEFNKASFNPIHDYLNSLKWDGKKRVDNLLVNCFGADDNVYSHEAIRKSLVAAVARVFNPGTKYDLVLVLVSEQGTFKSTFFKKLGREWFSDTFSTVQGKEAFEQLQGAWIIEMGELAGLRKAEVETIKHFITKCEDSYRPAYGRTVETYKRQCVFFGTTNNKSFLKDPTGNRRFMPIDVVRHKVTLDVRSEEFDNMIDQIWAEAVALYKSGEKLYLSIEADNIAETVRLQHSETDERRGIIEQYLSMKLPENWDSMSIIERRRYITDPALRANGVKTRMSVCVAEIWCECLEKEKEDMSRYNTREINDIMRGLRDWELQNSPKSFSNYGKQKYYAYQL